MTDRHALIVAQSCLSEAADILQKIMDRSSSYFAVPELWWEDLDKEFLRAADELGYVVMHVERSMAAAGGSLP